MGKALGGWGVAACALAWMGGVAAQLQQPALWPAGVYAACLVPASMWAVVWMARGASARARSVARAHGAGRVTKAGLAAAALALAAAVAVSGFGWAGGRATVRLSQSLPAALEGRDLWLEGAVAQMPQVDADGVRFTFDVDRAADAAGQPATVPPHIALYWARGWQDDAFVAGPPPAVRAGQRWRLPVRLRQPHGLLNPEGFDAELWLFEQGLRATGSVHVGGDRTAQPLPERGWALVEPLRQSLRDGILTRVADPHAAGVLAALAVGDQAAIAESDWGLFRVTGVAHLMSISGLHITMFAWLAAAAVGAAWRRSARAMHLWPAPSAARWGGLACATLYCGIAGWGVPAQRTLLMLGAVVVLRTIGLPWPPLLICGVAGAAVSALDPWALLQPGFWLSFCAVALLIASEGAPGPAAAAPPPTPLGRAAALVRSDARAQVVASLGLAPLTLLLFQQVSLVGLLANLVAVPVVTFLVTPLALLGALWAPLWSVAAWLLQPLLADLGWLASAPQAQWTAPVAPGWALAAGLLGGAVAVLPLPWRVRALSLPLMLPLLASAPPRPAEGRFELLAADVGQGSAVLVRTRNHLLLHDAGPQYARDSDAGARVLLPLLRARGERRIDMLMLSHRDNDHVGGAAALLDGLQVGELRSSLEPGHPLRRRPLPQQDCAAGQAWTWDGVRFAVLHPLAADLHQEVPSQRGQSNAVSCVLRIEDAEGRSALLTGDIEAPQEAALIERQADRGGERLHADVLLVPHHGSRTSSSAAFIAAVAPRVAVIQAGYRNRFGHPAPDVLARYAAAGVPVVRSDHCGAWQWSAAGAACTRDVRRRYWQWTAPDAGAVGGAVVARVGLQENEE